MALKYVDRVKSAGILPVWSLKAQSLGHSRGGNCFQSPYGRRICAHGRQRLKVSCEVQKLFKFQQDCSYSHICHAQSLREAQSHGSKDTAMKDARVQDESV